MILSDDYPNDKDGLITAIGRIPYDGLGTTTGNAINHIINTSLVVGNLKDVGKIVLIITDGESIDRVRIPARRLARTDALVYALPVQPDDGVVNMREIETIIGGPAFRDNVFTDALQNDFEALDEKFASQIAGILCQQDCEDE